MSDYGILQPKCPRCGWMATPWLDVPANREAAKAEVAEHIKICRGSICWACGLYVEHATGHECGAVDD